MEHIQEKLHAEVIGCPAEHLMAGRAGKRDTQAPRPPWSLIGDWSGRRSSTLPVI